MKNIEHKGMYVTLKNATQPLTRHEKIRKKKIALSFSARDVWSSRLLCMTNDKPELRAAFLISAANMQQKHDILEQSRGS